MSNDSFVLPCPFCGGECDPAGWHANDILSGPECLGCGASASSIDNWNRRSLIIPEDKSADKKLLADEQLIEWLFVFVKYHSDQLLSFWYQGLPIGRWIVEHMQSRKRIFQSDHIDPTAKLVHLFCNAVYNLGDTPLSEAWASEFSIEGRDLLEKNDYFRSLQKAQLLKK